MPRQPVRVQIFNQSYSLVTEDNPQDVQEVAHQVDELMTSIANRTSSGDTSRVAVLACLHLADKLRTAEKQLQVFEGQSSRIATMLEELVDAATDQQEIPQTA